MNILDTHIHIWDLERSGYGWLNNAPDLLRRTHTIDEIEDQRIKPGIAAGVLVQAENTLEDTELMLETAHSREWIEGVVGWLPLMSPQRVDELLKQKFSNEVYFKGVRHLIHDEPNADWLLQDEVVESLKIIAKNNLPFDVVGVLNDHITTALKVAELVPELRMVFDHMNQPPIRSGEKFGNWGKLMKEAANHKNFYVKISGLGTCAGKGNFNEETLEPYVDFILSKFGVDRCFCGGDWPVSMLAEGYSKTWNIYKNVLDNLLNIDELENILYGNGCGFYHIDHL